MGAGIAIGSIVPNLDYFRAICDGESEAMTAKACADAARKRS